jgi:isoleucyl-tRNA synthetase
VEQEFGKPGEKFTAAEFRAKCREYAATQVDGQRKDFIRLGVLGDWSPVPDHGLQNRSQHHPCAG